MSEFNKPLRRGWSPAVLEFPKCNACGWAGEKKSAREGEPCPACGQHLRASDGIYFPEREAGTDYAGKGSLEVLFEPKEPDEPAS